MDSIIETYELCKSYRMGCNEIEVLKDINMKINKGEFVSIMGSSGSGKSTLLYLLGGLDKPSSGSIKINGKGLSTMGDKKLSTMRRREVGFVFQFYNLIPNLNVEDNIMLPALLDGKKVEDLCSRLEEILDIVGLKDRRGHTPRELSGGQQQRVAIARALINEPNIIFADEPIGNLDSKTGIEIMELFKRINQYNGKTIIQVTHSNEAAKYGERTILMKDGRIGEVCLKR
ncbi:MAG: ABC transporter ATP-binding protein [Clostridia bacterium]|nr:ABC transporter ATP-binding protein [Clostridia bacterium]